MMTVQKLSLALFLDITQSIYAGDEDVSGEVTGESRACVAATVLSPACSVRLTVQSCSLQRFIHKTYMKTKIVLCFVIL